MQHDPIPPRSAARAIGFREFVFLSAALMGMNALSTDPMLPALPAIGESLNIAQANDRQLIITAYLLGIGIGSLFFGILSDRYGRKRVLGIALGFFVVSTIGCAVAGSFATLLASRGLAGFFAAATRVVTVGLVRDRFRGDGMARVMSLIFAVFMIVPVIAPSFGTAVLLVAPWRGIFWALAVIGALVTLWMLIRMPETLRPENRLPFSLAVIRGTILGIFVQRNSIGYMLASGMVMGAMVGFLLSIQQIFFDIFKAPGLFPFAFAAMAGSMGLGSLVNSQLVSRFGARRMSQGALFVLIAIASLHLTVAMLGLETMISFIILQAATMLCVSFTGSNFSAISMEPFARGAGLASSFQASVTTILSTILGAVIGGAFNGSTIPLSLGILLCGIAALAIVWWAERGKLFARYHRDELREPEPIR